MYVKYLKWLLLTKSSRGGYNIERIVEEGNYFCSENSISRLEGRTTSTNGNEINAKVGLLRMGEMLSGYSATMLTKNYTTEYSIKGLKSYWIINKVRKDAYQINNDGVTIGTDPSAKYNADTSIRPVIKVKNEITVMGGNGTWNNPYEI